MQAPDLSVWPVHEPLKTSPSYEVHLLREASTEAQTAVEAALAAYVAYAHEAQAGALRYPLAVNETE